MWLRSSLQSQAGAASWQDDLRPGTSAGKALKPPADGSDLSSLNPPGLESEIRAGFRDRVAKRISTSAVLCIFARAAIYCLPAILSVVT